MPRIQVLDQITIDKIAAGEVIERPASIVKELVENSMDAGATHVTVEIQDGGISLIRVTDNGGGIERADIRNAFLRHSTSKIRQVEDLSHLSSLGFRGEALSSIAAVTKTELLTKTREEELGTRYVIEGGQECLLEDAAVRDGTTFLIRQLFYNVPARRKFLKTPMTEAGHVQELLIRLALSHPLVAFRFINNGQEKLRTAGSGKLKDVIYSLYGREITSNLIEFSWEKDGLKMTGYLGKPLITRGNRNFENYFVNGRYVKNAMISKAIEDAYKDFVMQHKFPFVVIHFQIDGEKIDVNVHPTKMEMRFQKQQEVYGTVYEAVHRTLLEPELIPQVEAPLPRTESQEEKKESPFLLKPRGDLKKIRSEEQVRDEAYFMDRMKERVLAYHRRSSSAEVADRTQVFKPDEQSARIRGIMEKARNAVQEEKAETVRENNVYTASPSLERKNPETDRLERREGQKSEQLDLFEENFLKREKKAEYTLIGQVFETYWLVEFQNSLYIIDQHAAHERVLYERTLKGMKNREFTSQYLSPPIILSLSMQEAELLRTHLEQFTKIGFEIEPFGGDEYAVRAVPDNLFGIAKKELLLEMLDGLSDGLTAAMAPELIQEKVASMSCKAAVKGNSRLTAQEADALIGELLLLDNPYHCPHGRPTIISMTRRELEKKFKRIV